MPELPENVQATIDYITAMQLLTKALSNNFVSNAVDSNGYALRYVQHYLHNILPELEKRILGQTV